MNDSREPWHRAGRLAVPHRVDLLRDGVRLLTVQVPLGRALDIKLEHIDSITAPLPVVRARRECCMRAPSNKEQP